MSSRVPLREHDTTEEPAASAAANGTGTRSHRDGAAEPSRRRRALPRWLWYLLPLVLAAVLMGWFRSRPKPVIVVAPQERVVAESVAASGRVSADVETSVGASGGGRVVAVPVREGDRVRTGDILARLDDEVLRAQVRQAEEALRTARAQLAQASRPPLPSDVARLRADTAQAVRVAEAQVAAAQQQLLERQRGATPEERQEAEAQAQQALAQVTEAQVRAEQAERDLERQKMLFEEGAVARIEYERALTDRDAARASVEAAEKVLASARARLRQLQVGTRPEQIAQARAQLEQARAQVRGARESGEAQLRSLLATPRPEDVQVARARVGEAEEALRVARRRLEETVVRAPFGGTVTEVVTEPGGVTGPNQPIVRLVRTTRPEIRVDVDESNLGRLSVGQKAVVTNDAFPNQPFTARVSEIGAAVDSERGTVEVRLVPANEPDWLRPGQTVSVNVIVDPGTQRLVVPLTAVTTVGGVSWVLVVSGENVVERRNVEVGATGPDGVPVLSGLTAGDSVVVNPLGVRPGARVAPRVQEPSAPAP